jgi:hypothetical protein
MHSTVAVSRNSSKQQACRAMPQLHRMHPYTCFQMKPKRVQPTLGRCSQRARLRTVMSRVKIDTQSRAEHRLLR